jgi:CubicO group peptidase (beta-lactamase class C family)
MRAVARSTVAVFLIAAIGVLAVATAACSSRGGAPAAVSPALRPSAPFVPGSTTPARRARLQAIAPKLDELLRVQMRDAGATGVVAGVVLDGELAYARAIGLRDLESNDPIDGDTVFRIASMTKNVTAMAILKLRDEGKLSLDADASTYLPMLRGLVGLPRDSAITVRLLLTHASGLPGDDYWGGDSFGMSADELARFLKAGVKMSYPPGARYAYSNLGYALLGQIVERVSGRRFRDYVSDEILRIRVRPDCDRRPGAQTSLVHRPRPGLVTRGVLAMGTTSYLGARMGAAASPGAV